MTEAQRQLVREKYKRIQARQDELQAILKSGNITLEEWMNALQESRDLSYEMRDLVEEAS